MTLGSMSRPQGASVFPSRPRKKLEARWPFALASPLPTTRLFLLFFYKRRYLFFQIDGKKPANGTEVVVVVVGKNGKKKGESFFSIIVLIRFNYEYFVLPNRGQDLITISFYHEYIKVEIFILDPVFPR